MHILNFFNVFKWFEVLDEANQLRMEMEKKLRRY